MKGVFLASSVTSPVKSLCFALAVATPGWSDRLSLTTISIQVSAQHLLITFYPF